MASGDDRTEKATPKRREEARKEGQVARSMEVNNAFAMLGGFVLLFILAPRLWNTLTAETTRVLGDLSTDDLSQQDVFTLLIHELKVLAWTVGPIMGVLLVVGVAASVIQVRPKVTMSVLKPRLSRINPINGFKQRFGPAALVELLKNVVKLVVVAAPAIAILWANRAQLLALGDAEPSAALILASILTLKIGLAVAGAYIVIAITDYIWQRYRYEKQLRMTRHEVKQEHRQQEIAPELKAMQRRRQREMARRRMLADVPGADVVITNPTHYAIALKYEAQQGAPQVVAKGVDLLALRIREIAEDNGVTRVENRALARELYDRVEVGAVIPPELFSAVAEVLAYVYRLENRAAAASADRRTLEHA
jgi:flagellar biosynthetic protein FlhB